MSGVISLQTKWSKGQSECIKGPHWAHRSALLYALMLQKQIWYRTFFMRLVSQCDQKYIYNRVLYTAWYNKKPTESVELTQI